MSFSMSSSELHHEQLMPVFSVIIASAVYFSEYFVTKLVSEIAMDHKSAPT